MAENNWNVRGRMTTDVHDHDRRIGGRHSPRELTTQFFARVGGSPDPICFDFDMISTGHKKVGDKDMRITCRNCGYHYPDYTAKQCPECNIVRQGADTRKLRINIEVPDEAKQDWSIWLDSKRQYSITQAISNIEVEITDNPEYDVALISAELVGIVPDIHIFGLNLRTLIAKDIWMEAFYEHTPDKPTRIQYPHTRFDVGFDDDDPDYDKFDDNEDEYKGRWF